MDRMDSYTRIDVTLMDFWGNILFFVTSGLIKGLHPDAWSLLQLSIIKISMTTVVQKQF